MSEWVDVPLDTDEWQDVPLDDVKTPQWKQEWAAKYPKTAKVSEVMDRYSPTALAQKGIDAVSAYTDAIGRGATLGWGDELGAFAQSLAPGGKPYPEELKGVTAEIARDKEQYPYLGLSEFMGAMGTGAGSAKLIKNPTIWKYMGLGIPEGAASAAGFSEPGERKEAAAYGGLIGAALPAVARGAQVVGQKYVAPVFQKAKELGFKLYPKQAKSIDMARQSSPAAYTDFLKGNQKQANRIVSKALGKQVDEFTPEYLGQMKKDIGNTFDLVYDQIQLPHGGALGDDLIELLYNNEQVHLFAGGSKPFQIVKRAIEQKTPISGKELQAIRKYLEKASISAYRNGDGLVGDLYEEAVIKLDDVAETHMPIGLKDYLKKTLKQARDRWATLKIVDRSPHTVTRGNIDTKVLSESAHNKQRGSMFYGQRKQGNDDWNKMFDMMRLSDDVGSLTPSLTPSTAGTDVSATLGSTLWRGITSPILSKYNKAAQPTATLMDKLMGYPDIAVGASAALPSLDKEK